MCVYVRVSDYMRLSVYSRMQQQKTGLGVCVRVYLCVPQRAELVGLTKALFLFHQSLAAPPDPLRGHDHSPDPGALLSCPYLMSHKVSLIHNRGSVSIQCAVQKASVCQS